MFSWTAVNAYGKTTFLTLDFVDIKDNVLEITGQADFGYMRMIIKFCLRIKMEQSIIRHIIHYHFEQDMVC